MLATGKHHEIYIPLELYENCLNAADYVRLEKIIFCSGVLTKIVSEVTAAAAKSHFKHDVSDSMYETYRRRNLLVRLL